LQYYHDRSITIKPTNDVLADSVSVRFYFLESEAVNLINAAGCATCSNVSSAYELGVSQYDDYDPSFENGSISDNQQGLWQFITNAKSPKVPFDKGYYTEFKVKAFSEFWLSSGGLTGSTTLPAKMTSYSVTKMPGDNILNTWTTGSENEVLRYEIEVARSIEERQANQFQKIGEVVSKGNSTTEQQYSFTDTEPFKTGTYYYRVKTTNKDGSFVYSFVRSVSFDNILEWKVVPNPSTGLFQFIYQLNAGETLELRLTDATGRLLLKRSSLGNGFSQKQSIDIRQAGYAPGIYILYVNKGGKIRTFKLHKQ
jgi:hypothetical protein